MSRNEECSLKKGISIPFPEVKITALTIKSTKTRNNDFFEPETCGASCRDQFGAVKHTGKYAQSFEYLRTLIHFIISNNFQAA